MRPIPPQLFNEQIIGILTSSVLPAYRQKHSEKTLQYMTSVLDALYANIPEKNRISYGRYYTIKLLAEKLYELLPKTHLSPFAFGKFLIENSNDFRIIATGLGLLAHYGREKPSQMRRALPFFKQAASHQQWETRECAAGFFQHFIKTFPNEIKPYLHELALSPDPLVRRFVSESLRPVTNNQWLYSQPEYSLSILRHLFSEPNAYPRTSVGNNLSDLARRLPDLVYDLVEELVLTGNKNAYWIAYRACRNLVKSNPRKVMDLLQIDEYKYKKRVYRRTEID